jgi:RNA polymerase sigma-70 factor, ECF subfamily
MVADILIGNYRAHDKFVEKFDGLIRGVIGSLQNISNEERDDLIQDCYAHLWDRNCKVLRKWRGDARLSTYLHQVVYRRALETLGRIRGGVQFSPTEQNGDLSELVDPRPQEQELNIWSEELRRCISIALNGIRNEYREIFRLKHDVGLAYSQIAEQLNITVNNVGVRLSRAESRFRESFLAVCPDHHDEIFGHQS